MVSNLPREKFPLAFFLLLIVITIPYWVFGETMLPIPIKLPISALAAFNPFIAAVSVTYMQTGSNGVKQLLRRVFDYQKIRNKVWYLPILLLNPLIYFLSYVIMRFTGLPLPNPIQIPILTAPAFFAVFFVFGIGEELGWMGYAFDPLQNRWGTLKASIFMGFFWALYHLIPDLQNGQAADWIFWQRLGTVLLRILFVWIYNNTGRSVFSMVLFHAAVNISWALFPNNGSHYNPLLICLLLAATTMIVIFGWGPKTLANFRFSKRTAGIRLAS